MITGHLIKKVLFILNIAVGGKLGGNKGGRRSLFFPAVMEVGLCPYL
jgi:hypothetical protein